MTRLQLILRSLAYHSRIHVSVVLAVAVATAVLTGALLVGDSVRGSLRALTLERLGRIDAVLALDRFFRLQLADDLAKSPVAQKGSYRVVPAILFPQATLERRSGQETARASSVLVLGCGKDFWELDVAGVRPSAQPATGEVILNEALAAELNAEIGSEVTLRLPKSNQVPADSPLANKNDRIRSVPNLKVIGIVPTKGLGRFSLQATQSLPLNAFVATETLQDALEQPDKINALLVGGANASEQSEITELSEALRPKLADFSVNVKKVVQTYRQGDEPAATAFEYFTITTDRMIFDPEIAKVLEQALQPLGGQPILTYLANSIAPEKGNSSTASQLPDVPYSMVTAIDFTNQLQLKDMEGQAIGLLAPNEIVLNSWTADDLQVKPGDRIAITYFEPETTHGEPVERTKSFTLKAVTPLIQPARKFERNRSAVFDKVPTLANDPNLTPEVKGVTDQQTIDSWDAPFPFDYKRVLSEDEEYWDFHRTTPKAFISWSSGKDLWGSRFGTVTSYRVPASDGLTLEALTERLETTLAAEAVQLGFDFLPIKQRQLAASRGTTPFDVLFLSLSFFVIAAALLMVALLFQLGIEQRATEIGTFLAVGFTRASLGRLFALEGLVISAIGALIGIGIGVGYARLMLAGLATWWLGAISTPFLEFHWTVRSLLLGYALGVIIAVATIAWSLRRTRRVSVRSLLAGNATDGSSALISTPSVHSGQKSWLRRAKERLVERMPLGIPLVVAILLSAVATRLGGMAQAGAFVGGGAALLMVLLLFFRRHLRRQGKNARPAWTHKWLLWSLAERSAARNPSRSVITVGLMATATFLIVAMSSFRLAPTEQGIGGFRFIAESAEPIYADLNTQASWNEYFGSRAEAFAGSSILGMRLRPGDDASCQNLYQSTQPQVLGVTDQVIQHFDSPQVTSFTWAASAAKTAAEEANPWHLLADGQSKTDTPIPVILDKNTAMYSLHLYRGVGEEFDFTYDNHPIRFRVTGLLENSVLQGSLLIGEADFRRQFPQISGYRYFLISTPDEKATAVATALEDRFSDQGLDVTPARDVLDQLLAVQNTYLSTFQSLGALGLLLGAFGLVTVQLRGVLERRGELALLRAVGYRRRRLAELVLLENIVLLAAGLVTGIVAALLAVLPHKLLGNSAISWLLLRDLTVMLSAVFFAGLISSYFTIRAVLRLPLVAALRGD